METASHAAQYETLYRQIFECRKCPNAIPSEVPRSVNPRSLTSPLVLMAQAPAEAGVRKSGRHWVGADGKLHPPGGPFLDKHLRTIGFTIDPLNNDLPNPYTTNVMHCWTGRAGKRARPPTAKELLTCWDWWTREVELLAPQVIILLGSQATKAFGRIYGYNRSFRVLLEYQGEEVSVGDRVLRRFVLPHPTAPIPASRLSTVTFSLRLLISSACNRRRETAELPMSSKRGEQGSGHPNKPSIGATSTVA